MFAPWIGHLFVELDCRRSQVIVLLGSFMRFKFNIDRRYAKNHDLDVLEHGAKVGKRSLRADSSAHTRLATAENAVQLLTVSEEDR